MTRQLIIILTFLLAACGQNPQSADSSSTESKTTSSEDLQTFSITKATVADFDKAKKLFVDKTLYDTTIFRKANGVIKLPVDQKWEPFVTFTDTLLNTDESEIREYHYVGQFEKIGFYIVGGSFWEHSEYYLIDKRTGRQTITWSSPTISPTDKFIANLSMTYGLEGVPNGIQAWRIDRNQHNQVEPISLSMYLELDQQIWAPEDFVWETDNSIILKVAALAKYMNETGQPNSNDFYYLRLKIQ
jgi:starvation-inducible outer membrane lipoprotein